MVQKPIFVLPQIRSFLADCFARIAHNLQVIFLIDRFTLWQELMMYHAPAIGENYKQNLHIRRNLARFFRSWRARVASERVQGSSPYATVNIRNASAHLILFFTQNMILILWSIFWNRQKAKMSQNTSKQNSRQKLTEHSKWLSLSAWVRDMSTNITPQKNRKLNIRSPQKFKIRDTFWKDHVWWAYCQILMLNELIVNVQNLKLMVTVEHSCSFNRSFIHSGKMQ